MQKNAVLLTFEKRGENLKKYVKRYSGLGIVLFVLFLVIYYWQKVENFGHLAVSALSPLIGGLVIAYIVNLPMTFFEHMFFGSAKNKFVRSVKRPLCILLAFVALAALIFLVVTLIFPELLQCIELIVTEVPPSILDLYEDLDDKYEITELFKQSLNINLAEILDLDWRDIVTKTVDVIAKGFTGVMGSIVSTLSAVFSTTVSVFMSFIFAVYLLAGKESLIGGFDKVGLAYLSEKAKGRLDYVLHVANQSFHRFIVGQVTEAIILGVLCCVGMSVFGFPYATMIGTLVGFTALIPIAGAYIGAVVGAIMIWTASSLVKALFFVLFIVVLQQLEGNLIYPKVVGTSMGLPGIWVLAAVTIAGSIGGIPAMIIGVPIAATVYRLLKGDVRRRLERPTIDGFEEHDGDTCEE